MSWNHPPSFITLSLAGFCGIIFREKEERERLATGLTCITPAHSRSHYVCLAIRGTPSTGVLFFNYVFFQTGDEGQDFFLLFFPEP